MDAHLHGGLITPRNSLVTAKKHQHRYGHIPVVLGHSEDVSHRLTPISG
jgi:hypothetical protein